MVCYSVASIASHHHSRVAGKAAGTDAEAASEPGGRFGKPLGLREQPLEVERVLLLTWLQF